ncbi:MAG: hypothetical protein MJ201_01185 [Mycoplasmoidaceae bacterium]|nr:hypothetical protein [Mycoplasmoidaceae bacterium]
MLKAKFDGNIETITNLARNQIKLGDSIKTRALALVLIIKGRNKVPLGLIGLRHGNTI